MTNVPDILFLAGATASGKSEVAVQLALDLNAEIVSADAYQVYKGMEILTAAPNALAQTLVPHHMIGFLDPSQSWDASSHYRLAMDHISDIHARGKRALIVGGSGLYLKFLSHGLSEAPPADETLRRNFASRELADLVDELKRRDPEGAAMTNLENRRYVERNLEIVILGGKPLKAWRENWSKPPSGPGWVIVRDPDDLESRILKRTRLMFDNGVVEEVRALGPCAQTAERTLGLQVIRLLASGKISREEAERSVALATRQYAKRQKTWLRRETWLKKLEVAANSSSFATAAFIKSSL